MLSLELREDNLQIEKKFPLAEVLPSAVGSRQFTLKLSIQRSVRFS